MANMPRWEQGTEERLKQSAIELFDEQGFQNTSAVQIAKHARVTTRTFFRYFADKEEILFADADMLCSALVHELLQATDVVEPLQAVTQTLAGFNWESLASRESHRRRDAMIASNPELLERELIKQQQMADAFSSALHQRGVDPDIAELAARVGIQVFRTAYRQWLEADDNADLATMTETVMGRLATIVPANTSAMSPHSIRSNTAKSSTASFR
jgi:AcrR family transcriptional regulator